jgi:hypothetical protein
VTAAGGTQFTPRFDSKGDDVGFVSEQVWNDSGGASGGGVSAVFAKPAYQKASTPQDGHRDIPDIAIIASPDLPGVFLGDDASDPGSGCPDGQSCINCCDGGTSLSAPLWAGIARVLEQVHDGRMGNLNPLLYRLGPSGKSKGLRDVTVGNNNFHHITGFSAKAGYDLCTGWGTPDIAVLAEAMPSATATPRPTPTATPIPSGTLSVSPRTITFSTIGIGTTAASSFSIMNTGPGLLTGSVNASRLEPPFSLAPNSATSFRLANMQSAKVVVQFAPISPGSATGSIVITGSDTRHSPITVSVSGKAVSGALSGPKTLNFGTLKVGAKQTMTIMIRNTGLGVLNGKVDTSALLAPFAALSGTGSFSLKDGQSLPIAVQFQPTAQGASSGTISITSDGGSLTIAVSGTGS